MNMRRMFLVYPKRAAMLLDRIMVALHHALEDEDTKEIKKINDLYRNGQLPLPQPNNPNLTPKYYKGKSESDAYYGYKLINGQTDDSEDMGGRSTEFGLRSADYDQESGGDNTMDLQRRGHSAGLGTNKSRVYWRCYFNAVTCF
ncbi:CLUMA_CG007845, isoform A [Clunio marinus]|uniref:CLUMA_CG007845, isoform A n=1 Tax=Clunio marinus TaxID=568069 RepID=A0A1J1I3I6_9DIPT|nr:CLUMA_CG007845, isoform A [Clunio marinus]